jgi:protein TonB
MDRSKEGRGEEAAMFDDTRSAILPGTEGDRWTSLLLAFGFHGAVGVTLLLAAVLVVRPVSIAPPPVVIEVIVPVDLPSSGGPPPRPASPRAGRAAAPLPTPPMRDPVPVKPVGEEPVAQASPPPWAGFDFDLGPGVAGPGAGLGAGRGTGDGSGPGEGPGQGEPMELSGSVEPPALLVRVEPSYPQVARAAGIQGRVVLRAVVGTDGSVERVQVVSSPHPLLAQAAEDAVMGWRYRPATWHGRPVRVWFTVRVDFVLR